MSTIGAIHRAFLTSFPEEADLVCAVDGPYEYHHYVCDGVDDRGWGCGYRTLQTLASWVVLNDKSGDCRRVPSISNIQETILKFDETKSKQFVGSKEWIGCYEMFLVLDGLFGVPCRLVHCRSGSELTNHVDEIVDHLKKRRAPIPIGGDRDCGSKAIFGVKKSGSGYALLVVDPHFVEAESGSDEAIDLRRYSNANEERRTEKDLRIRKYEKAIDDKFVRWMDLNEFSQSSFYNLCFPIV